MQFTRPFTGKDLHYFQKAADLGFDFVELLVPEPEDGLDLAETRRAAEDVQRVGDHGEQTRVVLSRILQDLG